MQTNQQSPTSRFDDTEQVRALSTDPILAELWAIKAQMNREANYDIATLANNARLFAEQLSASRKLKSDCN
jgi:hypothetical protein